MARRKEIDETVLVALINKATIAHCTERGNAISVGECEGVVRRFYIECVNQGYRLSKAQEGKKDATDKGDTPKTD
jgi:hypothetical protein